MIRILLVLVAVLVAVLAFVFDRPWLYVAAAIPLVGALGLLGRHLWAAYQKDEPASSPSEPAEAESLEDLGITNVRPQEPDGGSNGASEPDEVPPGSSEAGALKKESPDAAREPHSKGKTRSSMEAEPTAAPSVASEDRPVLGPFLESLRAALDAETVCLLVQEEVILEYRVEALASAHAGVQRSGRFETSAPLLTATMSRQPVTVRTLDGDEERTDLAFYDTPPAVDQVALAPVSQPDTAATVFLLADATAETDLSASRARSLLDHFADTVPLLQEPDEEPAGRERATTHDPSGADRAAPADDRSDQPRPRREIVAEEMKAADAGDEELALVLIHLNRAESIARQGEGAVATAEKHLRTRLEHLAPGQRVERFGELTYGLFPRRGLEAVEAWAADIQDAMAQETGELEGGVSVGVAVRGPRHDAEELRADATEALREAYETGTCTIVA